MHGLEAPVHRHAVVKLDPLAGVPHEGKGEEIGIDDLELKRKV
jgi:hypothetical protein